MYNLICVRSCITIMNLTVYIWMNPYFVGEQVSSYRGSISSFREQASHKSKVSSVKVLYKLCQSFKLQLFPTSPVEVSVSLSKLSTCKLLLNFGEVLRTYLWNALNGLMECC